MSTPPTHPPDALVALLYGELEGDEAQRVQTHVDGCPECAATLAGYRDVRLAASGLPRAVEGAAGLASLLQAGAQAAARTRRRRAVVRAGTVLASAAALALVAMELRPRVLPEVREAPSAAASAPSAVGALAENEAPAARKEEARLRGKLELPQAKARERQSAPAAAPASGASAAKALPALADAKRGRNVAAQPEQPAPAPPSADANRSAEVALAAPEERRAAAVTRAGSGVAGGAGALKKAPAEFGRAESATAGAQPAPAAEAQKAALTAADSLTPSQREVDEERERALVSRFATASAAEALPLLSELCAVQVRLGRREEGRRTCRRVVKEYPGTPEAVRAQGALEALGSP